MIKILINHQFKNQWKYLFIKTKYMSQIKHTWISEAEYTGKVEQSNQFVYLSGWEVHL